MLQVRIEGQPRDRRVKQIVVNTKDATSWAEPCNLGTSESGISSLASRIENMGLVGKINLPALVTLKEMRGAMGSLVRLNIGHRKDSKQFLDVTRKLEQEEAAETLEQLIILIVQRQAAGMVKLKVQQLVASTTVTDASSVVIKVVPITSFQIAIVVSLAAAVTWLVEAMTKLAQDEVVQAFQERVAEAQGLASTASWMEPFETGTVRSWGRRVASQVASPRVVRPVGHRFEGRGMLNRLSYLIKGCTRGSLRQTTLAGPELHSLEAQLLYWISSQTTGNCQ